MLPGFAEKVQQPKLLLLGYKISKISSTLYKLNVEYVHGCSAYDRK